MKFREKFRIICRQNFTIFQYTANITIMLFLLIFFHNLFFCVDTNQALQACVCQLGINRCKSFYGLKVLFVLSGQYVRNIGLIQTVNIREAYTKWITVIILITLHTMDTLTYLISSSLHLGARSFKTIISMLILVQFWLLLVKNSSTDKKYNLFRENEFAGKFYFQLQKFLQQGGLHAW